MVAASNRRLSADYLRTIEAQFAADAGLERAVYETWFKPQLEQDTSHFELTLEQFRAGLDEAGILAGSSVSATRFSFGPPVSFEDTFEHSAYLTTLRRVDVGEVYTLLRLDSTGWVGNKVSRRVAEDFKIAVPQRDTTQFALLSNQAHCVFCHTQITSLEVGYDAEGNLNALEGLTPQERSNIFKNKARIRVGILESLLSDRIHEMKSLIAGTLYSRGETNLFASNATLYTVPLNKIDGHTTSRLSSDEAKVLSSAINCAAGCNQRLEVAYRNYPLQGPDGELPQFPSLIADDNQNRLIEHSEWRSTVSRNGSGLLKGGIKKRVDTTPLGTLILNADRSTGLKNASATLSSAESVDGVAAHLVLEGSVSSPLVLSGNLYVNGDVIIHGRVTGDGKIVARGNIYIAGDIIYACDQDSRDIYWSSSEQTICNYGQPDTLPRLGLVAGKSIMLGNYMMPNLSAVSAPEDHLTRQSFAATSPEDVSRWFIDAGQPLSASSALSYTMIQAALFNQQEYDRAKRDSSYTPRFYRMREDSPVWLCASELRSKEDYCKQYIDLVNLSTSTRSEDVSILNRASLLSLTPTGSWLASADDATPEKTSELLVRSIWVNAVETRSAQSALHVDGVLFSNNAMFGLLPKDSKTLGKALLNGSLMIADYAFLPTNGLRLHHDVRLSELIDPKLKTLVVQTRSNYRLLKADEELSYQDIGY